MFLTWLKKLEKLQLFSVATTIISPSSVGRVRTLSRPQMAPQAIVCPPALSSHKEPLFYCKIRRCWTGFCPACHSDSGQENLSECLYAVIHWHLMTALKTRAYEADIHPELNTNEHVNDGL